MNIYRRFILVIWTFIRVLLVPDFFIESLKCTLHFRLKTIIICHMENKSRIYFSDFFLYFGFLKIRNLQHRSHFLSGIGIFKASHCLTSVLLKIIVFLTLHKSSYHTNTGILILFAFLILIIEIDLTENIHCIKRHK